MNIFRIFSIKFFILICFLLADEWRTCSQRPLQVSDLLFMFCTSQKLQTQMKPSRKQDSSSNILFGVFPTHFCLVFLQSCSAVLSWNTVCFFSFSDPKRVPTETLRNLCDPRTLETFQEQESELPSSRRKLGQKF